MRISCLVFVFLFMSLPGSAQQVSITGYNPVGKLHSHRLFHGLDFTTSYPTCAGDKIPSATQINGSKFETYTTIKTASQAAQLGITWTGSASGQFSADQLVAITDTTKSAPCLATDGVTTVFYGRTIRTVVIMNDYTVKAGATIAIVAASATADAKTNSVDLYEIGFNDPVLDQKLLAAKQIVSGSGIGIENYDAFIKAVNDSENYALTVSNPAIAVVSYESPYSDSSLQDAVAVSWALKNISDGRGCLDAIKAFKLKDVQFQNEINSVYASVANGCGVSDTSKAKAVALLGGLKITY